MPKFLNQHAKTPEETNYLRASYVATDGCDGAWFCCKCLHENRIIHRHGNRPFDTMDCGKCDHSLCCDCTTTDVIEFLSSNTPDRMEVPKFKQDGTEGKVRYASICQDCGQSHRASPSFGLLFGGSTSKVVFQSKCKCKKRHSGLMLKIRIGSNEDWRESQADAYMKAVNERIDKELARYKMERAKDLERTKPAHAGPGVAQLQNLPQHTKGYGHDPIVVLARFDTHQAPW